MATLARLRRLRTVNVPASIRHRRRRVLVHRRASVRIGGEFVVATGSRLRVGAQWDDMPYWPGFLYVARGGRVEVTGDFDVYTGLRIAVYDGAVLRLGSGYINHDVRLDCLSSITIGERVAIGPEVALRDSDNHWLRPGSSSPTAPIVVGDDVWIGKRATILKGVTIGSGAVVAAGAVVTHDVSPRTLVGGVPARVLRSGVSWSHEPPLAMARQAEG